MITSIIIFDVKNCYCAGRFLPRAVGINNWAACKHPVVSCPEVNKSWGGWVGTLSSGGCWCLFCLLLLSDVMFQGNEASVVGKLCPFTKYSSALRTFPNSVFSSFSSSYSPSSYISLLLPLSSDDPKIDNNNYNHISRRYDTIVFIVAE